MNKQFEYMYIFYDVLDRLSLEKYMEKGSFCDYIIDLYFGYIEKILNNYGEIDIQSFRSGVYFYGLSKKLIISPQVANYFFDNYEREIMKLKVVTDYDRKLCLDNSMTVPLNGSSIFSVKPIYLDRPEMESYQDEEIKAGEISILITYAIEDTKEILINRLFMPISTESVKQDKLNLVETKKTIKTLIEICYFKSRLNNYIKSY